MISPKYFGEPDTTDANGLPLKWGVHPDGLPVRAPNAHLLRPEEVRDLMVTLTAGYAYYKLPDQSEAYLAVKDRLLNGRYWIDKEIATPDPEDPGVLHVHLSWAVPDARPSPALAASLSGR